MDNIKYITIKKYLILSLFYLLANGIIIFNNGIFWDDWCLYNMSFEGVMTQFNGNGLSWYGYFHYFLNGLSNPTLIYNSLTIGLQILSSIFLLKIVVLLKLNQKLFYLIVILASISPFFMAKNTMICLPYTLNYFLFFLAFYFLVLSVKRSLVIYRILALILFFLSFMVNSFIVFYIIPFVIIYIINSKIDVSQLTKEMIYNFNFKSLLRMSDLIFLPVIFFIYKKTYLNTEGLYKESYNKITLDNILGSPKVMLKSLVNQIGEFLDLISQYIFKDLEHFLLFSLIISLTIIIFKRIDVKINSIHKKKIFIVGVLCLILAILPYVFVQKPPSFVGYDTRHQLLMPIGVSLIMVSLILSLFKSQYYKIVFITIFSIFITISFNMNLQFIKGGFKQESLILNFRTNKLLKMNKTIIYHDNTSEFDATKEEFRFYSLNGISKLAIGVQNKLICDEKSFNIYSKKKSWIGILKEAEKFNMKDYKLANVDGHLSIYRGTYDLDMMNTFKLVFWNIFDKNKAWWLKKSILVVELTEVSNNPSTLLIN